MQTSLAKRLPILITEIDELVINIAERITSLPPDKLLQRAWHEFAAITIQKKEGYDHSHAMRMIDYVQCVITSFPPSETYAENFSEDEWIILSSDIRKLFFEKLLEYQMCVTAYQHTQNPNIDINMEEFRFCLETHWVHARGKRYSPHEQKALLGYARPASAS